MIEMFKQWWCQREYHIECFKGQIGMCGYHDKKKFTSLRKAKARLDELSNMSQEEVIADQTNTSTHTRNQEPNMTHPFNKMNQWVGSPIDYRTGKKAEEALAATNDNRYWNDETGSILVDKERWQQAQRYESDTWMKHGHNSNNDRDLQHTANFGNYEVIPHNLRRLVEIGCGPFTQTYNVLQGRKAEAIVLVDPLLEQYRKHPHCRYDKLQITGSPFIPEFHSIPAEDFTGRGFDTAICINVLEHVRDATKVMENLVSSLRKGGILIFHDRTYDDLDITKIYDVGHPIRITSKFLEPFLKQFTPLRKHSDYFIGIKN
jgi:SAM-dependent methyltransferase